MPLGSAAMFYMDCCFCSATLEMAFFSNKLGASDKSSSRVPRQVPGSICKIRKSLNRLSYVVACSLELQLLLYRTSAPCQSLSSIRWTLTDGICSRSMIGAFACNNFLRLFALPLTHIRRVKVSNHFRLSPGDGGAQP